MIKSFTADYRFLSNFFPATVTLDGLKYPSVENAYQAAKNFDKRHREKMTIVSARQAKVEGSGVTKRPDWDDVKVLIMTNLVREKFQNELLRGKLLNTGDEELVEGNNWGDVFWGVCDGNGENHLGKILMTIRGEMRRE